MIFLIRSRLSVVYVNADKHYHSISPLKVVSEKLGKKIYEKNSKEETFR